MAKGYWNVSGAITNPEGMGAYISAAEPYLAKCGRDFSAEISRRMFAKAMQDI